MEIIQLTFSIEKKEGIHIIRAITFDKNTTELDCDSVTLELMTHAMLRIFSNKKERASLYGQDILNSIDFDSEE